MLKKIMTIMFIVAVSQIWIFDATASAGALTANGWYEEEEIYYILNGVEEGITERGKKHLLELINVEKNGHRAVMMFVVQRNDGKIFKPAVHIDPDYADTLKEATAKKVEILVYRAHVDPIKIELAEKIQWKL